MPTIRDLIIYRQLPDEVLREIVKLAIQQRSKNIQITKMNQLNELIVSINSFWRHYFDVLQNDFFMKYPMNNRPLLRAPTLADLMFGDYQIKRALTRRSSPTWQNIQSHVEDIKSKLKLYLGIQPSERNYLNFNVKKQQNIGNSNNRALTPLQLKRRGFYDVVALIWAALTQTDANASRRFPLTPIELPGGYIQAVGGNRNAKPRFEFLLHVLGSTIDG